MITEKDLQEAIAECEGQRNPGANTCMKLAAFYTIKEHLYPSKDKEDAPPEYRQAPPMAYMNNGNHIESLIEYESGSEFSQRINGKPAAAIWPVMDELMDALMAINPRLYDSVMRKIK